MYRAASGIVPGCSVGVAMTEMLQKIGWLALAGSAGALARYGLSGLTHKLFGAGFPWGTLAVNMLGCLAFGVIWGLSAERNLITPEVRNILLVGFMGAFTTFSSFAYETTAMLHGGAWLLAGANVVVQNVVGIALTWAGIALARVI
jgi:fluoride exporter